MLIMNRELRGFNFRAIQCVTECVPFWLRFVKKNQAKFKKLHDCYEKRKLAD